jgi:hypothetical protein
MTGGSKMVRQPSRIHHTNKRNPLTKAVMPKSDSPAINNTLNKEKHDDDF